MRLGLLRAIGQPTEKKHWRTSPRYLVPHSQQIKNQSRASGLDQNLNLMCDLHEGYISGRAWPTPINGPPWR